VLGVCIWLLVGLIDTPDDLFSIGGGGH